MGQNKYKKTEDQLGHFIQSLTISAFLGVFIWFFTKTDSVALNVTKLVLLSLAVFMLISGIGQMVFQS